jgi:hypothetical protein
MMAQARGPAVTDRTAKLGLYKECVAIGKNMPDETQRRLVLKEVRTKWKEGVNLNGDYLALALASTLDRIAYGRLCLTKQRQKLLPNASENYDWGVKNPLHNHAKRILHREKLNAHEHPFGQGSGRDFVPVSNWDMGNVDPDIQKRHNELTERGFFMGPTWRNRPKPVPIDQLSVEEQFFLHTQAKPVLKKTPKKNF